MHREDKRVDAMKKTYFLVAFLWLTPGLTAHVRFSASTDSSVYHYGDIVRSWKGYDWETLNRLFEKGMISDPKTKAKSVLLSDQGAKKTSELYEKLCLRST